MEKMTPADARSALADADGARAALTGRGRWVRGYLIAFAAGSVALVLLLGLAGRAGLIAGMTIWFVLVVTAVAWSSRQRVVLPGSGRLLGIAFGVWGALYGIALAVGLTTAPGSAAYWVPAAVVVALPLLGGAALVGREPR